MSVLMAILGAITALGTLAMVSKYFYNQVKKTPEEKREEIAKDNKKQEDEFAKSGRPS